MSNGPSVCMCVVSHRRRNPGVPPLPNDVAPIGVIPSADLDWSPAWQGGSVPHSIATHAWLIKVCTRGCLRGKSRMILYSKSTHGAMMYEDWQCLWCRWYKTKIFYQGSLELSPSSCDSVLLILNPLASFEIFSPSIGLLVAP